MALKKLMIHWSKGRSLMGIKARAKPRKANKGPRVHLIRMLAPELRISQAVTMPAASSKNCLRVMLPTRRNL